MLIDIFIFLTGLAVGSFLNVAIHRLPREESIIRPRSYCPQCGEKIGWRDNVPVLSFLLLRGHCRNCSGRISWRYPLVELASGLLWYGSWKSSGGLAFFGMSVVFFSLLLVVSVTDLETGLIPDRVTFLGMGMGLAVSFLDPTLQVSGTTAQGWPLRLSALAVSAVGLGVGGGLVYGTAIIGDWIFQKESMGGGDVKLLAMAGSFLGWEKVLLSFFTAPFLALPFALYQRLVKKEEVIPYGPFLSLAAAVQFLFGETFWRYFLRL